MNFTGINPVHGSFTDDETGGANGYTSCGKYATTVNTIGVWVSPSPPPVHRIFVQGKALTFTYSVGRSVFHGPGTYASSLLGVSVGGDQFTAMGAASSVTVNADGSGHASFTGYDNVGLPPGTESGTITWTCSG